MKIIYNRYIPFGNFFAINLFGVIFARKDKGVMSAIDKNHEFIHTLQQREMLFVFFYIWYITEWMLLIIKYHNTRKAYKHISFEQEAYRFQHILDYPKRRKPFSWIYFIRHD